MIIRLDEKKGDLREEQEKLTTIVKQKLEAEIAVLRSLKGIVYKNICPVSYDAINGSILEQIAICHDMIEALEGDVLKESHVDLVARLADTYRIDRRIRDGSPMPYTTKNFPNLPEI